MAQLGKTLLLIGVIVTVVGLVFMVSPKIPWLGHLPGDISIKRQNVRVYVPIATSIVISILLTLLLNLFRR
jgi:hypothetical protein